MTQSTTTNRKPVTEAQLSACHRLIDFQVHCVFYHVTSASQVGQEYEVRWDAAHRVLTCTCEAGNPTIINGFPSHPVYPCWHKDAAVAHAYQYRQQQKLEDERAMDELSDEIAAEERIANAPLQVATEYELEQAAQMNENRTFRFMR